MQRIISILLILVPFWAAAQTGGFVNNGVRIVIPQNSKLDINGGQNGGFISNAGTVELDGTFSIEGDWNNASGEEAFTYGENAEVIFDGDDGQTIVGETESNWPELTIAGLLNLTGDLSISNKLNMDEAHLVLNDQNLTLENGASFYAATDYSESNMIITNGTGSVIMHVSEDGYYVIPLGDRHNELDYTPAAISIMGSAYADDARWSARVSNSKHDEIDQISNYVNRYWTLEQHGISDFTANVFLNYNFNDVVGVNPALIGQVWDGETWQELEASVNNQITGVADELGDFAAFGGPSAINDLTDEPRLYVSHGKLIIEGMGNVAGADVRIYNTLGQLMKTGQINSTKGEIDMPAMNSNYCLVQIHSDRVNVSQMVYVP